MDPNLLSALLYSMSTIAQTLSGAMGLLGAIALFALQATTRSVERAATKLAELPHQSMSHLYVNHLLNRRSFHELARLYGEALAGASSETSSEALVHFSTLSWELDHDTALRKSFWTALRASGAVITYSLICLALAPQLAEKAIHGQVALAVGVVGAIGCLALYAVLLQVMLRSSPQEPIPPAGTRNAR